MTDASCQRLRPMLGTFVAIECRAADAAVAERAVDDAYAAIARVDALMHPRRGDLATINAAPLGRAVQIDAWTWQVLALSKKLHDLSGGRFDPCLPERPGTLRDIVLPAPGQVICSARVAIDLGGIAKGFAVDRAVDALRTAGCSAGQVNAGGDVRVFGDERSSVWVRTHAGARSIALRNEACAVSDTTRVGAPPEHRGYYCRIAGVAVAVDRAATVVAPTAAVADALTKCVLLCDDQRTLAVLLAGLDARSL